ncbi:MAG: peroxidase family protein, partial [Crocosphaera sp.]
MNKKIQINTFSRRFALSVTGATSLSFGLLLPATAAEFRSMDGTGNNIADPDFGATETELLRLAENAYEDGISIPRGGDPTTLSSARAISNAISAQSASIPNSQGVSDWVWQWGQFLDHDLSLTPIPTAEPFNIEVPLDDTTFTPGGTIEFNRSAFEAGTGTDTSNPREQFNEITAYLDASSVYGSDDGRAEDLRTHDGTGQLLTTTGANGEILLPFNTFGLDNDNGPGPNPNPEDFFIAGDDRANEQVGLIAIHTLLVREHNRTAAELEARLDGGDAELIAKRDEAIADPDNGVDDEGDFIYESTRKVVGGIVQIITYEEWLPIILGEDALEEYDGYDDTVDAGISTEFSTAAFRFGHTMLSPDLLRVDNDGNLVDALSLRDSFFNPDEVFNNGIDTIFLGLASQEAQEVDTQIIDDVRNFLFTNVAPIGFDLPALNIQRGRDHGIPPINVVRAALG